MGLIRIRNLEIVKRKTGRFSTRWTHCFRIVLFIFVFLLLLAFSFNFVAQKTWYGKSARDTDANEIKMSSLSQRNVTTQQYSIHFVHEESFNNLSLKREQMLKSNQTNVTTINRTNYSFFIENQRPTEECPENSTLLVGHINVNPEPMSNITENDVLKVTDPLKAGGEWYPDYCIAKHTVAIIIPFRNRKSHLLELLYYLHPMLQRQQLHYRIFVVEQYGNDIYNKGALMNAGFIAVHERKLFRDTVMYTCFVFHDVDMIPEDDRNLYSCKQFPEHLSVAVNEMHYKLPYSTLVGGVFKISAKNFLKVNGYSNLYWGWGAEDDDMSLRLSYAHLPIHRPPSSIARYTMIKHIKGRSSPRRFKLLYSNISRSRLEGLNSMKHKIVNITNSPLFSLILVDVGPSPKRWFKSVP